MKYKIYLKLFLLGALVLSLSQDANTAKIEKLNDNILVAFNSAIIIKEQSYGLVFFKLDVETRKTIIATVTGYNTVHAQTDSDPCISASGHNICGRKNVVACPRSIKLGTWVIIDGIYYQCLDRMNRRFENRFDISFDKDIAGALEFGRQEKSVIILSN